MITYPKRNGKWAISLSKLREFWVNSKTTMMVSGMVSMLYPHPTISLEVWEEIYGEQNQNI